MISDPILMFLLLPERNKIYDPGICIKFKSTRFLATLSPVIDNLLPFSSKNEENVFNYGVLASKEKSPPYSSHRGFKASKLFIHKSLMLIHGENTPNLGVRHLHSWTKLKIARIMKPLVLAVFVLQIWIRVEQMMKGSSIGGQEKKAKLFNEWEMFAFTEGESIESYYHCFSNIVHQTKDLHEIDYIQLYNFLKFNQVEVDAIRVEILARTHDPLALMAHSYNPYNNSVFHLDQPYPLTYMQQPQPNNNYIPQPSFNMNYMQQPMPNPEDISDPTTAMNMSLVLMAKAFKLNYSTSTNNNQRTSSNPHNRQIAQSGYKYKARKTNTDGIANQNVNQTGNGNVVAARAGVNGIGNNGDIDEIEEVNANCILIANLLQASTSGTQTDKALVYDSYGSAEVHHYENCYDNEIFNMFTQEEQDTELREPITEPHQVQQNNNNVISVEPSVEYNEGTVEQHPTTVEETQETLQLAQESLLKMKQLNKEIKLANNAKINKLSEVFVSQKAKSREEVYFSNTSKTASVSNIISKSFSIPDDEFSDDTPSVAHKFLNEVKDTIVTLQSVIKHRMNADINKWSSPTYQEFHKIIKDEIAPIVNQVDARVQNIENHFVKEAAKFVRDFKSLAKEVDSPLDKITVLEKENERLLRAVVSRDIISIVQSPFLSKHLNSKLSLNVLKKAYNDMQHQIERLQAQLVDLKGKSSNTQCASNTLDPLSQKLDDENMSLEY
ncbi:hypothetical protein Tco_0472094 [Tanacetum coccineum]